jgi:FMN reductase
VVNRLCLEYRDDNFSHFVYSQPNMTNIVLISGSPSVISRSDGIVKHLRLQLTSLGFDAGIIDLRDLPPADLIYAHYDSEAFSEAKEWIAAAAGVVVATPIYKASYSGILKTFLDILPQNALRGKTVLPIASGGSPGHLLAIDYALKPVLSVLGATDLLQGVYAVDEQVKLSDTGELWLHDALRERLRGALDQLAESVNRRPSSEISFHDDDATRSESNSKTLQASKFVTSPPPRG